MDNEAEEITLTFDAADFTTPQQFHAWIARELHFPSYYGENLAALNDCLEDLDRPLHLDIENLQDADSEMKAFYGKVFVVLERCFANR